MKKILLIGILTAVLLIGILVTALSNEEKLLSKIADQEVLNNIENYKLMSPEDAIRLAFKNYNEEIEIEKEIDQVPSEAPKDVPIEDTENKEQISEVINEE